MTRSAEPAPKFSELPLPVLLLVRWQHMRFGEENPSERSKASYKRKEHTILGCLSGPFPPIERCGECGVLLDRHATICPSEVA